MMLVCSSGKGCDIRKDWPSQRCPSFKLCQGYVIEKRKINKKYEHMGDAKDFLEQLLYLHLPIDIIHIVADYFGIGTVVFDNDKVILFPKKKNIILPFDNWIKFKPTEEHNGGLILYETIVIKLVRVIRKIILGRTKENHMKCIFVYVLHNNLPEEHVLSLKWYCDSFYYGTQQHTTFCFPLRSQRTILNQLFVNEIGYTNTFDWWLNFHGLADHYDD